MPFFTNAKDFNIHGGSFNDVKGDMHTTTYNTHSTNTNSHNSKTFKTIGSYNNLSSSNDPNLIAHSQYEPSRQQDHGSDRYHQFGHYGIRHGSDDHERRPEYGASLNPYGYPLPASHREPYTQFSETRCGMNGPRDRQDYPQYSTPLQDPYYPRPTSEGYGTPRCGDQAQEGRHHGGPFGGQAWDDSASRRHVAGSHADERGPSYYARVHTSPLPAGNLHYDSPPAEDSARPSLEHGQSDPLPRSQGARMSPRVPAARSTLLAPATPSSTDQA